MRILGFDLTLTKATPALARPVDTRARRASPFAALIEEPFTGAWQRNIACESAENILKFSAVYACVDLIASDISKLRIKLVARRQDDIWEETTSPAFSPVLRKANRYQTRIQFISQWVTSKLLWGNAYVLKQRDARNVVTALYVLDPARVTPLVTREGDVWYELKPDDLAQVPEGERVVIPASELIHDRMLTLWHPLVGVSPIYACGSSATQGIRIQSNSEQFFGNLSRPGGVLTFPFELTDELAEKYKRQWNTGFSGANFGRIGILGGAPAGGVMPKFEAIAMPANDAQLIEQLRWTVEDVARCFHVPAYKLGIGAPTLSNYTQLNNDYYTQSLQSLIESIEVLLDEGLATPPDVGTEFDLDNLLRMDPISLAEVNEKAIKAGYLAPNEARQRSNLMPVDGGNSPYMQQQNFSLEALARRDSSEAPPGLIPTAQPTATAPPPQLPPPDEAPAKAALAAIQQRFLSAMEVSGA